MGSLLSCFTDEGVKKKSRSKQPPRRRPPVSSSFRQPPPSAVPAAVTSSPTASVSGSAIWRSKGRSGRKDRADGVLTHEEALAAARLLLQDSMVANGTVPFDRSSSLRFPPPGGGLQKKQALPRSSSTRPRSAADPLVPPQQLVNQDIKFEGLETKHFVLVHGGGFGAWCWYKTIAYLEEGGFKVDAIDLTGSGIHAFNTNSIESLSEYVKPLLDFLEKCDGKVILVGHDFGGACISYAMEVFPEKIAKAVFVSAAMLNNGQSILDMFSQQAGADDLMRQAQKFVYANGKERPPTAIDLDKALIKHLLFNQSPAKDIALASVSLRTIPFAPVLEKLLLSDEKYGSVRRFYIETTEDNAIPLTLQQSMCNSNPPERVFLLKGSDHAPFFSKPQALHRLLVDVARFQPINAARQMTEDAAIPFN